MQSVTEALTEVKPARIGYFTIRGSRERNPLGYRCAGVNLTVAVSVGAGGCASGGAAGCGRRLFVLVPRSKRGLWFHVAVQRKWGS